MQPEQASQLTIGQARLYLMEFKDIRGTQTLSHDQAREYAAGGGIDVDRQAEALEEVRRRREYFTGSSEPPKPV